MITCEAVAVLPQASVAVNVLVTVYSLAQVPGVVASVEVIVTVPQASVAVGVPKHGVRRTLDRYCCRKEVNTGAVLSSTVITCDAVAVLPQASVAVNVLVTVYSLAQVPGVVASVDSDRYSTTGIGCSWCTERMELAGHSIVTAAGTEVNTGAVLSSTVITCEAVAVLPQASVAVNVLVTVYSLAQVPGVVASVDSDRYSTTGIGCSWCTEDGVSRTLDSYCCRYRSKYRCSIIFNSDHL